MRLRLTSATLACTLSLLASAAGSSAKPTLADDSRQAVALWLSQQIHQPVAASQILTAPSVVQLDGCFITRVRRTQTGATSLSLRCSGQPLPQLVLLDFSVAVASLPPASSIATLHSASRKRTPMAPPIVRAGAALNADWRTESIHAQLPVVALDSGAAGAEIRVRIANTSRTMRARILGAHTVTIVTPGA